MLNRWRKTQYLDDGVVAFQCLKCYKGWNSTSSPESYGWKYCPYCGTEWQGEHKCNEHGHKNYDAYVKMTDEQRKTQSQKRRENEASWELQCRIVRVENEEVLEDWQYYHDFEHDYPVELFKDEIPLRMVKFAAHNLRRAKELNKNAKEDLGFINEYRLVLLKPVDRTDDCWYDYNKKEVVRILT